MRKFRFGWRPIFSQKLRFEIVHNLVLVWIGTLRGSRSRSSSLISSWSSASPWVPECQQYMCMWYWKVTRIWARPTPKVNQLLSARGSAHVSHILTLYDHIVTVQEYASCSLVRPLVCPRALCYAKLPWSCSYFCCFDYRFVTFSPTLFPSPHSCIWMLF